MPNSREPGPSFADRLRELRTESGYRQIDLAHLLKLGQTTIANYERGTRFPDQVTLRRIADHFGVTLDFLLGRSTHRREVGVDGDARGDTADGGTAADGDQAAAARGYLTSLLDGKFELAREIVARAEADGASLREIYLGVFAPALEELGRLWTAGDIDVGTEHFVSEFTRELMAHLFAGRRRDVATNGRALLAVSASGELHDIGLRMISNLLELEGWRAYYLGVNVPSGDITATIIERSIDLLAISVTMQSHVESAALLIDAVRRTSRCARVKIIVGGRAFNGDLELWRTLGADGFAPNALAALACVKRLIAT